MSVSSQIQDGTGTEQRAKVNGDQALYVTSVPYPPLEKQRIRPFRQFLTDDGLSTGSNDMAVDGSVNNVDFFVEAADDADRYITTLSFEMTTSAQMKLFQFGTGTALTNGLRLFYERSEGEVDIHDSLKSNFNIIRLGLGTPTPGGGTVADNFIARHVTANNDYGIIPVVELNTFMPPFGIKLDQGTKQRLVICVQDDASNPVTFDCIAYGFDRFA